MTKRRSTPPPLPVAAAVESTTADAPYATLTPDRILDAVESIGLHCDGRLLALNSYENRVYRVGVDDAEPVIAKFYRPGRWSDPAILEEHEFAHELAETEIPLVPPLKNVTGTSLHRIEELRFALYPNRPGRAPELDNPDVLEWIGRFIGRIHGRGETRQFRHRGTLSEARFGVEPVEYLTRSAFIPAELRATYASVAREVLAQIHALFELAGKVRQRRLHGDCHPGNIMWTPAGPHFVDLDDCLMGPAVQDLWMLLAGDRDDMQRQLGDVLAGYDDFCTFDARELVLIEALRTLRIVHYAAWLARRWTDPAFPLHFPWFNSQRYWQDHILSLREQQAAMQEPPLFDPR